MPEVIMFESPGNLYVQYKLEFYYDKWTLKQISYGESDAVSLFMTNFTSKDHNDV